jgi:NarL family two-component system response regulator LiaR
MTIRVILIDDNQDIHDAVAALLRTTDDILLVGQSYSGDDALELCRVTRPDLALMDVVMPGLSGAEATRQLLAYCPSLKVLVLSSFREYEIIKAMLDAGASGYVVKDAIAEELLDTIRAAHSGSAVFSAEVAQTLLAPPKTTDFGLTDREMAVLGLMAEGLNNGQIADRLEISVHTVRFHLKNILAKLGVDSRSAALVLAAKSNLI